MSAHSVARAVAALAPGKRVIVLADGKAHELPERPEIAPAAPDALQVAADRLLESDAQSRAILESVGSKFSELFARVGETSAALSAGYAEVVASVNENTRTLRLPMRPIYDKDGKLIAAERAKA